jgi:glycosyltransferase involved in cell wall biosynthesis
MKQPLVSIYIPTKNRPGLLLRAISSCLSQSYQDLEIIVVDDGSDQQATEVIQQIATLDPRIVILRNDVSLGACAARNLAINAAKGEFITGLDDDDEFTSDRIANFVAAWSLNPNLSFLSSGYKVIQRDGYYSYACRQRYISFDDLLYANYVGNQMFTRTEYLLCIAGFDVNMSSCQDYDVWIRLSQRFGSGYRLNQISYIVHQEHESPRISHGPKNSEGYRLLIQKHRSYMSDAQYRSQLFYQVLNTEQWSCLRLLALAGTRNIVIALKNIAFRYYFALKNIFTIPSFKQH